MRLIYNIFFHLFFALSAPFYFLKMWRRGNWQEKFGQRFGKFSAKVKQAVTNRHVIWFHAVSVGEVNICTQLIHALEPRLPNVKVVVSTTTSTGMAELKKKLPSHIEKVYYPIDKKKWVTRAIATLHPEAIILVEAEIWPNFLWRAMDERIPVFLVNARLSERSFRGYKRFGFLFRQFFQNFAGIGCQNEDDAKRLRSLGARPERLHVVGNMKYDSAQLAERLPLDVPALMRQLGVAEGAPILIGGSTHRGEEAILAEIFLRLKKAFPDLFLILVPRHHERGREVGTELEKAGVPFKFRTEISPHVVLPPGSVHCLLVNTTGELRNFYSHSDIVFVGKSLTADGGQNPIEPGALGKAMIFGPRMQNFTQIAEQFVKRAGAIQVQDAAELEKAIVQLLVDPQKRQQLGANAQLVVRENLGAVEKTVELILQHLAEEEIYVASLNPA